jgi:hypothetical protein
MADRDGGSEIDLTKKGKVGAMSTADDAALKGDRFAGEAQRPLSEQRAIDAADQPPTQQSLRESMKESTRKDRENQQYQLDQQRKDKAATEGRERR